MKRVLQCLMCCVLSALAFGAMAPIGEAANPRKTENVIFVMTDGLRWQEVFRGAESPFPHGPNGGHQLEARKKQFCRETPEASREALLPFLWNVVAKEGQIYGNQAKQSMAQVTNGLKFSYPGYSETLCGFPDSRIDRNDVGPNPNVTVLEWLHRKPAFRDRVVAFGTWHVFNEIFNRQRCSFCVNAGYDPLTQGVRTPTVELINQLKVEMPQTWEGGPYDALTFHTALEFFKANRPRVLYLAFGETDHWGHAGRYDKYLASAHCVDDWVKTLWEIAQGMPEYRHKTTLIVSTDHGRGCGQKEWRSHGKAIAGSENIWMAFLGPDTPALGERANVPTVTQSQMAATLAALLGEDYCADVAKAAKPIADVLGKSGK